MKNLVLKSLFFNKAPLIILSILLGYSFWYIASYDQIVTLQINIPLCFSTTTDHCVIDAPEKIDVALKGKRADLYALDTASLAAHVTIDNIAPGKHGITLTQQDLFLPKNISLVHYKPANLTITVAKTENI